MNECAVREDSSPASAPPAAVGIDGTFRAIGHYRASGCGDRCFAHQTGEASPKNCRNPVLACLSPNPDPPSRHAACCLRSPSRTRLGDRTVARALRRLLSTRLLHCSPLIFLPFTDIVPVCAHTVTPPDEVGKPVAGTQCLFPIVTVTPSRGHFVPLKPCWKQERGFCLL